MRVMLVYPPISMLERYSSEIGNSGGRQVPVGIFYLAAYLRRHGHEVRVVDGEAHGLTPPDIVATARDFAPQLIGIGSTAVAFHRACEVARALKDHDAAIPIVLGGPHVSACAEHALALPEFDYGVIGEGEETLLELVERLADGSDVDSLPGLALRQNGSLRVNPRRTRIEDLDGLPYPAYDMIPDLSVYNPPPCNYKQIPVGSIVTSRGCPNACTFCDQSVFGRRFRQRSAGNIADEIEHLWQRYGIREVAFLDDTLTLKPQLLYELFDELDHRGLRFPWTCMSRINTVDHELLEFMRDHGLWHVSFGIESGNEEILRRIKKRISLDRAREVVGWCAELGIRTKGFFIIGHPGETVETIDQSIELALELPLDDVVVTLNTPIPGSEQHRDAGRYGSLDETDWSQFNYWRPVFVPVGLDRQVLIAKQKEFYRRFYLRPRVTWRYAKSFLSPSGVRRFWALCHSLPYVLKGSA